MSRLQSFLQIFIFFRFLSSSPFFTAAKFSNFSHPLQDD
ncbi:hypothetical protein D1AOALGA4SA_9989 [Olavius algarvensis Delta 1 endosymbiont]|nr:hypothetical protein D1AOALGA4SA_9989 [Olavius algarvensis Delta 1 endosymbiont]